MIGRCRTLSIAPEERRRKIALVYVDHIFFRKKRERKMGYRHWVSPTHCIAPRGQQLVFLGGDGYSFVMAEGMTVIPSSSDMTFCNLASCCSLGQTHSIVSLNWRCGIQIVPGAHAMPCDQTYPPPMRGTHCWKPSPSHRAAPLVVHRSMG